MVCLDGTVVRVYLTGVYQDWFGKEGVGQWARVDALYSELRALNCTFTRPTARIPEPL